MQRRKLKSMFCHGSLVYYRVLVCTEVIELLQTSIWAIGFRDTKSMRRAMLIGTIAVGKLMPGMNFSIALTGLLI